MGNFHSDQTIIDGIHIAHSLEFVDEAARLVYAIQSTDIGKIVRQLNDNSFYIISSLSGYTSIVGTNAVGGDLDGYMPNPSVVDLTIPGAVQGSILYYDGINWTHLGPSTDGYVLTTHGILDDPTWEDSAFGSGLIKANGTVIFTGNQSHGNNDITNIKLATFFQEVDDGYSGASETIDWNNGQKQRIALDSSTVLSFTDPPGVCNLVLKVIQDLTGGRLITWPTEVLWPGGTAPILSTGGGAVDLFYFYYDGTDYYGGTGGLNFS